MLQYETHKTYSCIFYHCYRNEPLLVISYNCIFYFYNCISRSHPPERAEKVSIDHKITLDDEVSIDHKIILDDEVYTPSHESTTTNTGLVSYWTYISSEEDAPKNQSTPTDNDPRRDSLIYANPDENEPEFLQKNIVDDAVIDGTEGVGQLEGTSSKPIYGNMNNNLVYETSFVQSTA